MQLSVTAPASATLGAAAAKPLAPVEHAPIDSKVPIDEAGRVVPVPISDVPEERFSTLLGFFHRNPGWMKTGPIADAARGALDHVPWLGEHVRELTEPA